MGSIIHYNHQPTEVLNLNFPWLRTLGTQGGPLKKGAATRAYAETIDQETNLKDPLDATRVVICLAKIRWGDMGCNGV